MSDSSHILLEFCEQNPQFRRRWNSLSPTNHTNILLKVLFDIAVRGIGTNMTDAAARINEEALKLCHY